MDKVTKVVAFLLLFLLHGACALQLLHSDVAVRRNHVAGDQLEWFVSRLEGDPSFYQDWATRSGPFYVGDIIEFRYFADDAILQVDANSFYSCFATKIYATYTGGHSVVALNTPGMVYFISKDPTACAVGLKVSINVV